MRSTVTGIWILALVAATGPAVSAEAPDASRLAAIAEEIAREEYRFDVVDLEAAAAPNRAHDLRTTVRPTGIEIVSRTRGGDGLRFALELRSVGRAAGEALVEPGLPFTDGARAEIRRPGITEWIVNDERGVEHGFDLDAPPAGDGEVMLRLALDGPQAYPAPDGRSIELRDPTGRPVLRYGGLVVFDATGAELPARMEVGIGELRIVFDDAEAVYPVTVDPLATSPTWTVTGSGSQGLGASIASAGDVNGDGRSDVIVGLPAAVNGQSYAGGARLYLGTSSGVSTTIAWSELGAGTDLVGEFGLSVSTAGDLNGDGYADVIVGAPGESNGQTGEGRAYVFYGGPTSPYLTPGPVLESNQAGARFGHAVAWAGDVNGDGYDDVVVGAPLYDAGSTDEGRIYVYRGSASGLVTTPFGTGESNSAFAQYGFAVATIGDVNADGYADLAVGAPYYTLTNPEMGRVYFYLGGSSSLGFNGIFNGSDPAGHVGWSVAAAGDVNGDGWADVVVGGPGESNGQLEEGMAWVLAGASWGVDAVIRTYESNQVGARLGDSVATAGDVNGDGYADVVVGAPSWDGGLANEGGAWVYYGGPTGVSVVANWHAESDVTSAQYGAAVAPAGDVDGDGYGDLLVGAPAGGGRAYAYLGGTAGLTQASASRADGQADADFGWALAAGDFDGDGFSDLLVGARLYDGGSVDEGRAFLFPGSATGVAASYTWSVESNQAGAQLGHSVASAGDVDNDGYDDILIGAPGYSSAGNTNDGRAYLFRGGSTGPSTVASWSPVSNQDTALFGFSVAGAGDVNGDGYADVIVGASHFDNAQADEGRVFLYLGGPGGLLTTAAWTAESNQSGALFGYSVAGAGDVNRDGRHDLIVGAPWYDGGSTNEGRIHVYFGTSGLPSSTPWTAEPNQANAELGTVVAAAGDFNGDGFADVFASSPLWDEGEVDEGGVWVYRGSSGDPALHKRIQGQVANARIGRALSSAGDVNRDGYTEIAIGSPDNSSGSVTVWYGSASGLPNNPSWSDFSILQFGAALAHGDFNGDGWGDLAVGAPDYIVSNQTAGIAWLFHGGGGRTGRAIAPRQASGDFTAPLAMLGRSPDATELGLIATGFSGAGRVPIAIETEIEPLGTNLNGAGTRQSTHLAPGAGGTRTFNQVLDALPGGPDYHWQARFVTEHPWFPRLPWFTPTGNGRNEEDVSTNCPLVTFYRDVDGDGFGTNGTTALACEAPAGYVPAGGDCNDADGTVHPGAPRIDCDGIDNDCSGAPDGSDVDGDGHDTCGPGDPSNPDGLPADNCPLDTNPDQADTDGDGTGDVCDLCPVSFDNDVDDDGILGPCIVGAGWRLERTVNVPTPMSARFHPLDGRIYVGQRSGTKGLYRVESNDSLTPLWTGDDIAGIVIDPGDGAVYAADDFSGEVFRTPFLAAGRTTWVTGWHADDDDPIGLAIAPPGSTNGIVAPGEALMVDRGSSGLDEIWRWSPVTAEGEAAVHVDDGTLIDAVDVAIGPSGVWVVDTGGTGDGAIYEIQTGGVLAPRSTSEPLGEPSGVVWDPLSQGLLVLDGVANGRGRRVLEIDPSDGAVTERFVAFSTSGNSWSGLDVADGGGRVLVTDYGRGRLYQFVLDGDFDDVPDPLDCDPSNHHAWSLPDEASSLRLSHTGGIGGTTTLTWEPVSDWGGIGGGYDLLRTDAPDGFAAADCVESGDDDLTATDPSTPASISYYLVVPVNDCGGNPGADGGGTARAVASCP